MLLFFGHHRSSTWLAVGPTVMLTSENNFGNNLDISGDLTLRHTAPPTLPRSQVTFIVGFISIDNR